MRHKINPQIDRVFKAILGSPDNTFVLIDFLNSILQTNPVIEHVDILNPHNEKRFLSDKLTIVDVRAQDKAKQQYQIEIQMLNQQFLPERMLYTWSDIYQTQLSSGMEYNKLMPVISIWLLVNNLFKDSTVHHHFQLYDHCHQRLLTEHCSIHVLELDKWQKTAAFNLEDHWLYFLKEAKNWVKLPSELNTRAMRLAMDTLQSFSEKEREYDLYRRQKLAMLDKNTIEQNHRETREALKATQNELNALKKKYHILSQQMSK